MGGKKSKTQEMSWLHTWIGLVFGWLLVPIFIGGSLSVFWFEIHVWAKPETHAVRAAASTLLLPQAEAYLKRAAPDARLWTIVLPDVNPRDPIFSAGWGDGMGKTTTRQLAVNGSGKSLTPTDTMAGLFYVYFHYALNMRPHATNPLGFTVVGLAAIAFLSTVIAGIVVHKRIFKDFFTFRRTAKSRQRKWLDAHNVLSVLPLPFHFMMVLTGLAYYCYNYIPSSIGSLYGGSAVAFNADSTFNREGVEYSEYMKVDGVPPGAPAVTLPLGGLLAHAKSDFGSEQVASVVVRDPGRSNAVVEFYGSNNHDRNRVLSFGNTPRIAFDGVSGRVLRTIHRRGMVGTVVDTAAALHMAWYGGAPLRMLYLMGGLCGAAMMATGQLLFTIKRREKTVSTAAERFFTLVDRINVATIAGMCFACIAHLWAARLLPYDLPGRGQMEVNVFWLAWLAALLYALARGARPAWIEQMTLNAALCIGLPLLGFLVPRSDIIDMIRLGDWRVAGVDLASVGFGIAFALIARSFSGRPAVQPVRRTALQAT